MKIGKANPLQINSTKINIRVDHRFMSQRIHCFNVKIRIYEFSLISILSPGNEKVEKCVFYLLENHSQWS